MKPTCDREIGITGKACRILVLVTWHFTHAQMFNVRDIKLTA